MISASFLIIRDCSGRNAYHPRPPEVDLLLDLPPYASSRRKLNGTLLFEDVQFRMPGEISNLSNIQIAVSERCDFGEKINAQDHEELRNSIYFRAVCGYRPQSSAADGFFWKDFLYEVSMTEDMVVPRMMPIAMPRVILAASHIGTL